MAMATVRRVDREQLERHLERERRLAERLPVEERRRVAEQRLAVIARVFET
jgi:hypothetical protein